MSKQGSEPFFPGPPAPAGRAPKTGPRPLVLAISLGSLGCLGVIVLVVVLAMAFIHAAGDCPPKDFPAYPNAQSTGFNYTSTGSANDCTAGWEADASPDQVASFYDNGFSSGPWELVNKDAQSGDWTFQRQGDPSIVGLIRFLGHGKQTRIEMEVMTGQSPSPLPSSS